MAPNSLYPAYCQISYHSDFGTHGMTLPTSEWSPVPLSGDLGSFVGWNGTPIDGEVMVAALFNKIKVAFSANVTFDTATMYTLDTPTSPARPRKATALAITGTNATTNWYKAVQHNWMFRDSEYAQSKLTFLDCPIGSGWDPTSDISGSAALTDIVAQWTGLGNAWSSRNGLRPSDFIKITYTLNDKLRKEYGMT